MERANEHLCLHFGGRKVMSKEQFLKELKNRLSGLPKDDLEDRISFYREAIDDRIEEGKTEEEAVNDLGTIDEIVNEIAKDYPLGKLVKEKVRPHRSLTAWEIIIIILGFPLWFPLLTVFFVLCFVFYLLIWVLVIVTYVIETALIVASVGSLVAFFIYLFNGGFSITALGSSLMCLGAAMLFVFACIGATKLSIKLAKAIFTGIKKSFMKKGNK